MDLFIVYALFLSSSGQNVSSKTKKKNFFSS